MKAPIPCSSSLKKPFTVPSKIETTPGIDPTLDLEGWKALYDNQFHKPVEYKPRNRFHSELMKEAESAKDTEKPELPLASVQNALVFKRMNTRRQIEGSLLLIVCYTMVVLSAFLLSFVVTYLILHIIHSKIIIYRLSTQVCIRNILFYSR